MPEPSQTVLILAQAMTILMAVLVAFHPNIIYAAVALLFTFLGVAVMFLFAGADFIAGAQVIIYVGGVTILVLFAIMLTSWLYQMKLRDARTKVLATVVLVGVAVFPFLSRAIRELGNRVLASPPEALAAFAKEPKTAVIGDALLGSYLLPFEGITVLLLGALVGAVWIARPNELD